MTDEKLLALWRSLPSDHVHIDDVIVQFGRLVQKQTEPVIWKAYGCGTLKSKIGVFKILLGMKK